MLCWRAIGGAPPVREYRFKPERKWRFDFAWPTAKIAVEIEGGTRHRSRHTSGAGFQADCEKYNEAAFHGWLVLRLTTEMVSEPYLLRLAEHIAATLALIEKRKKREILHPVGGLRA